MVLAISVAACSPGRAIESTFVLSDMAAGTGSSYLKRSTPEPERRPIAYLVEGRHRSGDLYSPGEQSTASVVVVPGVTPDGKDDPRLVAFATTLARARFEVLVPEIGSLRALKVSSADAQDVADAVRRLANEHTWNIGIIAFSYAVGPAILAALDPDIHHRIRFIVAVGGYYDLEAAVTFFTTGFYRADPTAPWRYHAPNEYGRWVFARSNADRLSSLADRETLLKIADRKMADPSADVDNLAAALGSEGTAVYGLLVNRVPERVPGLIAALPESVQSDMRSLDLSRRNLLPLAGRLVLIHGRDDAIIPFQESVRLAEIVPRSELYLVDSLAHVDLGPSGFFDTLRLVRAVYRVLQERDALEQGASGELSDWASADAISARQDASDHQADSSP